jgi:hypothetical protein
MGQKFDPDWALAVGLKLARRLRPRIRLARNFPRFT